MHAGMVMISSDMRLHWKCSTAVYARSLESQAAAKRPQPPGSSSELLGLTEAAEPLPAGC